MQTVSAELTAACQAAGQRPCYYLEFSWAKTGAITDARGAAGWTDESAYCAQAEGQLRINPPGERLISAGEIGQMTVTLFNDGRFSWRRADKALYAQIGGAAGMIGVPVRLWQGYVTTNGPEYVCIFTGLVTSWRETLGQVELECRDWGWKYLQAKTSTTLSVDQRPDTWIDTIATAAGITGAEMLLDVGIYVIPFAWMDDESVVEEIWDAAAADGGLAYFDQAGKLRYETPLHWLGHSSAWSFGENTYQLSEPTIQSDDVATKVVFDYSGRRIAPVANLYELDLYKLIMPGQTETWTARFSYAAYAVITPNADDPYSDYYAVSPGGLELTDDVTVTLSSTYGQQTQIAVANGSDKIAQLATLRIRGVPLIGGPTEQVEVLADPPPLSFSRVRSERGNPYCQTAEQARSVASVMALRCGRVRPIWELSGVPGIPQLELMDRVTFVDTRKLGSGESIDAMVVGIGFRAGGGGFYQDISLMEVTDLLAYDNYFIIGSGTLGASERAYY